MKCPLVAIYSICRPEDAMINVALRSVVKRVLVNPLYIASIENYYKEEISRVTMSNGHMYYIEGQCDRVSELLYR